MQLSLQDIRNLGYKKIFSHYLDSNVLEKILMDSIRLFNIKCSSYSFPRKWKQVYDNINKLNYYSIDLFMKMCEPMINEIDVNKDIQRKFRNKWDAVWKDISKLSVLDKVKLDIIKNYGIRLCFDQDIDEDILYFYNDLLLWSVFSQTDSNFEMVNLTYLDILCLMTVKNEGDFINYIKNSFL